MYLFSWCDFPVEQINRSTYVPISRADGAAVISTPHGLRTVSEKSLGPPYLSLFERVLYRKRVSLYFNGEKGVLLFPLWDFNGPDLPYFSTWSSGQQKPGTFKVGPWDVDGRELVADAKDRTLQMIEAGLFTKFHTGKNVRLAIYNDDMDVKLHRGWTMGNKAWLAFFSGVRKACESQAFPVYAVSSKNPYEGMTRTNPVVWTDSLPEFDGITIHCYGNDPFAMVSQENMARVHTLGSTCAPPQTMKSVLPAMFRSPLWNPMTKLGVFHEKVRSL